MTAMHERLRGSKGLRIGGAMGVFFGLKFSLGLVLIGLSSRLLPVAGFVTFSQLFLFFALLSTVSAAGVQNGLVRQVALANGDPDAERRAAAAAFRIWLAAGAIAVLAATLFRGAISQILVGQDSLAAILPFVTLAGVGGGYGILACATLNGRHRAPTSLLLQSAGLAVGAAACIWRLHDGDAVGAVLGYATGPLATSGLSAIVLRHAAPAYRRDATSLGPDIRLLLGYSVAFLAMAAIMPVTLFLLRYVYREAFGTDQLGYWLAANRVSDVTSQILGLYMAQIFLPQATRESDPVRLRRLNLRTLAMGSLVMLGGCAVFVAGGRLFVTTFLSAAYLPAIPFIAGYLLGDGLRVTASLASHLMLSRGQPRKSIMIEAATAAGFAAYLGAFAAVGRPEAPYWAYPATYATLALALLPVILRTKSSPKPDKNGI